MRNLLNFLLKYNHWFLFVLLEVISLTLLFRFNNYQGSAFFTSANYLAGIVYEASSQVTRYFGLTEVNKDLTARNVELEIEVERLSQALEQYTQDTTGVANLRKEALKDYVLYDARVVNNSITHPNNFITIDKGEADGIRPEMGVVCGGGIVGIVYQVSSHYAIVMPVLNSQTAISCRLRGTDYFGYLRWDGGHPLYAYLGEIPRHAKVKVGMSVETSGFSEVFPAGLFVGKVCEVHNSEDGLSYTLKVNLSTDFSRLRDVFVLSNPAKNEIDSLESMVETER